MFLLDVIRKTLSKGWWDLREVFFRLTPVNETVALSRSFLPPKAAGNRAHGPSAFALPNFMFFG